MLSEICAEIKNYFTKDCDRFIGDFSINDGQIAPSIDFKTDYFRIVGSRLNDGVHKVSELESKPLEDEDFHGAIWIMSPPKDFIALVAEIETWQTKNGGVDSAAMSPFQSESFGGYSYSKGNAANGATASATWQQAYYARLKRWRRLREL